MYIYIADGENQNPYGIASASLTPKTDGYQTVFREPLTFRIALLMHRQFTFRAEFVSVNNNNNNNNVLFINVLKFFNYLNVILFENLYCLSVCFCKQTDRQTVQFALHSSAKIQIHFCRY